ncbi:hypothetical protein LNO75_02185 [Mycoplasma sp. T363T]|uniref:hypothetical protein n=1 Tax=Mycoplasma bradburyae TaxID=2963128 RepID=UPI0023409F17|nr:hypothetical protein [Mycoplasma bradburyae]MDC4163384.1 hypothetical protein [Mycoplasma bradburyae]
MIDTVLFKNLVTLVIFFLMFLIALIFSISLCKDLKIKVDHLRKDKKSSSESKLKDKKVKESIVDQKNKDEQNKNELINESNNNKPSDNKVVDLITINGVIEAQELAVNNQKNQENKSKEDNQEKFADNKKDVIPVLANSVDKADFNAKKEELYKQIDLKISNNTSIIENNKNDSSSNSSNIAIKNREDSLDNNSEIQTEKNKNFVDDFINEFYKKFDKNESISNGDISNKDEQFKVKNQDLSKYEIESSNSNIDELIKNTHSEFSKKDYQEKTNEYDKSKSDETKLDQGDNNFKQEAIASEDNKPKFEDSLINLLKTNQEEKDKKPELIIIIENPFHILKYKNDKYDIRGLKNFIEINSRYFLSDDCDHLEYKSYPLNLDLFKRSHILIKKDYKFNDNDIQEFIKTLENLAIPFDLNETDQEGIIRQFNDSNRKLERDPNIIKQAIELIVVNCLFEKLKFKKLVHESNNEDKTINVEATWDYNSL